MSTWVQSAQAALINNRRRQKWARAVVALMAVVVFCTTYALILPAITATSAQLELACPLEVHQHESACYDEDGNLTCGQADFVIHTHDTACYTEDGQLVCMLPEVTPHTHIDDCYVTVITCGQSEDAGHAHTDACYEKMATCGKPEVIAHTHTAECCAVPAAEGSEGAAEGAAATTADAATNAAAGQVTTSPTCGMLEVKVHVHGDECFTEVSSDVETATDGTSPLAASPSAEASGQADRAEVPDEATAATTTSAAPTAVTTSDTSDTAISLLSDTDATTDSTTWVASGTCGKNGNNLTWYIDADYVLHIQGTGEMNNYSSSSQVPWTSYRQKIVEVEIEEGVTSIGKYAFNYFTGITKVDFPSTLTAINAYSFQSSYIVELTIPETVTTVGKGAFKYTSKLKTVNILNSSLEFLDQATDSSFSNSGVKEVYWPEGLNIPQRLFYNCSSLIEFHTSGGIEQIGSSAFEGCAKLQTFPLSEGLKVIKSKAFYGCSSFTDIKLPTTCTSVEDQAFANCINVKTIEINSSATIDSTAFNGDLKLETIKLNADNESCLSAVGSASYDSFTRLELGEEVKTISINQLKTIFEYTNNTVTLCSQDQLEFTITGDESATTGNITYEPGDYYISKAGVIYKLGENNTATLVQCPTFVTLSAFDENVQLFTFENSEGTTYTVTEISQNAFAGNASLEQISIPDTVEQIGAFAFYDCEKLASVNGETSYYKVISNLAGKLKSTTTAFRNTALEIVEEDAGQGAASINNTYVEYQAASTNNTYKISAELVIAAADKVEGKDNCLYTGKNATIEINLTNTDSGITDTPRVYFQVEAGSSIFDSVNKTIFSQNIGQEVTFNTTSGEPVKGRYYTTNVPYLYYLELNAKQGSTLNLNLSVYYPNYSKGGMLQVWVTSGNDDEAPSSVAEIDWITLPNAYTLSFSDQRLSFVASNYEDDPSTIDTTYLLQKMAIDSYGTGDASYGQNPIDYIKCATIFKPQPGLKWRSEVLEAIKNGDYILSASTYTSLSSGVSNTIYVYVRINDEWMEAFRVFGYANKNADNTNVFRDVSLSLDSGDNVVLNWTRVNELSSNDLTSVAVYPYVCKDALQADVDELKQQVQNSTTNSTKAALDVSASYECHFKYGSALTVQSDKTYYSNTLEGKYKFDKDYSYSTAKMWNVGGLGTVLYFTGDSVFPSDGIVKIEDQLTSEEYIEHSSIEEMLNDEYGQYLTVNITGGQIYPVANNQVEVVATDGRTVYKESLSTGENTGYTGMYSVDSCEHQKVDLVITHSSDGQFINVTVSKEGEQSYEVLVGAGQQYDSLKSLFDELGFNVASETQYSLVWNMTNNPLIVKPNSTLRIEIPSTVKGTFMVLGADLERSASNSDTKVYVAGNKAKCTEVDGDEVSSTSNRSYYKFPELFLDQSVTQANGQSISDISSVNLKSGDRITYTNTVSYYLYQSHVIPLVDRIHAGQVLLVPVEQNASLAELGLETYSADETTYYKLSKEGEYKNVWLGSTYADTVNVTKTSTGNFETYVFSYLNITTASSSSSNLQKTTVDYEVYLDPSNGGSISGIQFGSDNEAWLGDHQSHRLYADMHPSGILFGIDKEIVTNAEQQEITSSHDSSLDEVSKNSVIHQGDEVVYRLSINTFGATSAISVGNGYLKDVLPVSPAEFGNGEGYWNSSNVSIAYVNPDGSGSSVQNGEIWTITSGTADTEGNIQQSIVWNDGFSANVMGTLYIYVTLQFPSNEADWDKYENTCGVLKLKNEWQVGNAVAEVTHYMSVDTEAFMQKSVYCTGHNANTYGFSPKLTGSDSSKYYSNSYSYSNMAGVWYFLFIANTGNGRLYLEDIQDSYPVGFSVTSYKPSSSFTSYSKYFYDRETNEPLDSFSYVANEMTQTVSTKDRIISWKASENSKKYLSYDSELGKVYLKPGQYTVFSYIMETQVNANIEDIATNYAAMPLVNYCDADVSANDEIGVDVQRGTYTGIDSNDGTCQALSSSQALSIGFNTAKYDSDTIWLESDVSVKRGNIKPGISVECETSQQSSDQPLVWDLNIYNEGTNDMSDYTISDLMMKPYGFTKFTFQKYLYREYPDLYSKMDEVTIASFTSDEIQSLYESGDEKKVYVNSCGNIGFKFSKDSNDNWIATIHFYDGSAAIQAGGYGVVKITTTNTSGDQYNKDFIDKAYLTPSQTFSRNEIYKGNYVLYDTNDGNEGNLLPSISYEARVGVSYGYATASYATVNEMTESAGLLDAAGNQAATNSATTYIVQSDENDFVRYTLSVGNSGGANTQAQSMSKFVLVDNLSEVGDHSTLYSEYERYSNFKMHFAAADLLDFKVTTTVGSDVTEIGAEYYSLLFSEATEFDIEDSNNSDVWSGADLTAADGWYTLDECKAAGTLGNMRSMRLVIEDPECVNNLLPPSSTIDVSFNAELDEGARTSEDAQTAWNSFGYSYTIYKVGTGGTATESTLSAASDNVGVKILSVPLLTKQLVDSKDEAVKADADESFKFLIFKQPASGVVSLRLDSATGEQNLLERVGGDLGFPVTIVQLNVDAGETGARRVLDDAYVYKKDDITGTWGPSDESWKWENNAQYSIMELTDGRGDDAAVAGGFEFSSLGDSDDNMYTFGYVNTYSKEIVAKNQRASWEIDVVKQSDQAQVPLADAWFALYTCDGMDALVADSVDGMEYVTAAGHEREFTDDAGVTWFLKDVQRTSQTGLIDWDGLTGEKYLICEVAAPNNYAIDEAAAAGIVVDSDAADGGVVTQVVTNYTMYQLPESGGVGAERVLGLGCALIVLAAFALHTQRARQYERRRR